MRLKREKLSDGRTTASIYCEDDQLWMPITAAAELAGGSTADLAGRSVVELLASRAKTEEMLQNLADSTDIEDLRRDVVPETLLPFEPSLLRAFATSETHWIQGARGMVRNFMPSAYPFTRAVEGVSRRPFSAFKPKKQFYEEPTFYIGNHRTMLTDGAMLPWPSYTDFLDFEIELAAVVVNPVVDVDRDTAGSAIGGFVVMNDVSARDTQWDEVRNGVFGPVIKSKSFATAMGAEVVSADEVLSRQSSLTASVTINDEVVSRTSTADMRWTFEEMLSFSARDEVVGAGEVLSSGTLPNGCGLELGLRLSPGDVVSLTVDGVGTITNTVGTRPA